MFSLWSRIGSGPPSRSGLDERSGKGVPLTETVGRHFSQSSFENKGLKNGSRPSSPREMPNSKKQEGIQEEVDRRISHDRIVIFSKDGCPYCTDAKNVFQEMGQSYCDVNLRSHPKGGEVQAVLKEMTGASTVPRVFVDGKCIGGGSDTVQMYKSGALKEILQEENTPSQSPQRQDRGDKRKSQGGQDHFILY